MKKILVVLAFFLSFSSCSFDAITDRLIEGWIGHQEMYYHSDFDSLDSYAKIGKYIREKVTYSNTDNPTDIKNPYDTLTSGKGSCADYAALFMNIAYYGMGIKMNLAYVSTNERAMVEGGMPNHAIVTYQDDIIEPQNGRRVVHSIQYIYSFDEVFN